VVVDVSLLSDPPVADTELASSSYQSTRMQTVHGLRLGYRLLTRNSIKEMFHVSLVSIKSSVRHRQLSQTRLNLIYIYIFELYD